MKSLVLVRHGQSEWNEEDRFTGWMDVNLTEKGRQEAHSAGKTILDSGLDFRFAFTSVLTRAIETLHIIELAMQRSWIADFKDWRLNEKHYGILQGWNKKETAEEFGAEQVRCWRRAYNCPPPPLEEGDVRSAELDPRYEHLDRTMIPRTESLHDTAGRVDTCWRQQLAPVLLHRNNLLVVAHGNSLRALVMLLKGLGPEEVEHLEIPTGRPLLLTLDNTLQYIGSKYLGEE